MPQFARLPVRRASRAWLLAALWIPGFVWVLTNPGVTVSSSSSTQAPVGGALFDDVCKAKVMRARQLDAATANARYRCTRAAYVRAHAQQPTDNRMHSTQQVGLLHAVFTVDCTFHSLWQALTLELSWMTVNQPGFLTRIVTGCTNRSHVHEKAGFLAQSILLPPRYRSRFGVYFADDGKPDVDPTYAPSNRPSALHQFLTDDVEGGVLLESMVVLDPDMIFLRPLKAPEGVRRGIGAAQEYRYLRGRPFDSYVCGLCPGARRFAHLGGKERFNVGPPWILHREDLYAISATWSEVLTQLRKLDDASWVIDMDAYAVSAAHHNITHTLLLGAAVDSTDNEVAWQGNEIAPGTSLLHYCFAWEVGDMGGTAQGSGWRHLELLRGRSVEDRFFWSKYAVPSDWPHGNTVHPLNVLACDAPLLQEPHRLESIRYSEEDLRRRRGTRLFSALPNVSQFPRAFFGVRKIVPLVNAALTLWKSRVLRCLSAQGCSPTSSCVMNVSRALRLSPDGVWVSQYPSTCSSECLV